MNIYCFKYVMQNINKTFRSLLPGHPTYSRHTNSTINKREVKMTYCQFQKFTSSERL